MNSIKSRIKPQIYDIKMLNYTLDQKTMEQVQKVVRQAKSQNRNYKA